ncbi:MAG: response regulator [Candidatus Hodarchaeota archaeon]
MQKSEPLKVANTRVLIVEDSPITAKMTHDMLEDLGFSVSIASTGIEALQRVREAPPDLILMDIILKGELDGVETAKRIHMQFDIPVIYLTSFSEEKIFQRAKNTAPFGYLIKARMTSIELHRAVEIALYKHRTDKTIREFQKLIEKTLETSFDGIAVLDFEGTILLVNEALASMSGYSKVELTGLNISKITVGPDFTMHLIKSAKDD